MAVHRTDAAAQPARRAKLMSLAGQLPAAVLADLLNIAPTAAVNWVAPAATGPAMPPNWRKTSHRP